jgi:hypothetical protein
VQLLRIVLVLITLGCILVPIGTVVVIYRNDLSAMVVTPQLKQLFSNNDSGNDNLNNNGNNFDPNNNNNDFYSNNNPDNSSNATFIENPDNNTQSINNGIDTPNGFNPSYNGGQIITSQKIMMLTFSLTNSNSQDETLNSMGGTIEITGDQYQLGVVSLDNAPVTIPSGKTISVTVSGVLTSGGQNVLADHYGGVSSLDVTVVNGEITVNGVSMPQSEPQDIGNINIIS